MFTGIVEEVGKIISVEKGTNSAIIEIQGSVIMSDLALGHSVSVNGVCLTVTEVLKSGFKADIMHETLKRSNLGKLKSGSKVNLERAMSGNGRFGGHIVSGHIDGIGEIVDIKKDDNAYWYTISATDNILKYVVEKGSITIDGISLTVAKVNESKFSVSIIPHTLKETILKDKRIKDVVNLENDIVGKYIEKFIMFKPSNQDNKGNISKDFLLENGFF